MAIRLAMMALLVGLSVSACGTDGSGSLVAGACPLSETTGVLTADGDSLGLDHQPIRWPNGWSVRVDAGRRVIANANGASLAGEGDRVRLGGGRMDDNAWFACPDIRIISPSAPAGSAG